MLSPSQLSRYFCEIPFSIPRIQTLHPCTLMLPIHAFLNKKSLFHFDDFTCFRVFSYFADKAVSGLQSLRSLLRPTYDVSFCAYYKQEKDCYIRVGCCKSHRREEMRNEMSIYKYKPIDFRTAALKSGTKTIVHLKGCNETGKKILV